MQPIQNEYPACSTTLFQIHPGQGKTFGQTFIVQPIKTEYPVSLWLSQDLRVNLHCAAYPEWVPNLVQQHSHRFTLAKTKLWTQIFIEPIQFGYPTYRHSPSFTLANQDFWGRSMCSLSRLDTQPDQHSVSFILATTKLWERIIVQSIQNGFPVCSKFHP